MKNEAYKPAGLFISINDKGQYIYSDPFIKGGYLIGKNNYQKYRTYALRYVIGIVIAILFSSFIKLFPALIVGACTIIAGEILFRVKFLKKSCIYIEDYEKDAGRNIIKKVTEPTSKPKQIIKSILFVALGVLLVINAYEQNFTGTLLIICWIVGICVALVGITLLIIVLVKEKK